MEDYEQTSLELRLESELAMETNIQTMIKFVQDHLARESISTKPIQNRHEAYGLAAEKFSQVQSAVKAIKGDMATLLDTLGEPNAPALEAVGSISNSCMEAASRMLIMAAEMRRTLSDLYNAETGDTDPTPMDEYMDSIAGPNFEDAPEIGSEDNDD